MAYNLNSAFKGDLVTRRSPLVLIFFVIFALAAAKIFAQSDPGTVDAHLAAAKAAAGQEHDHLFHLLCDATLPAPTPPADAAARGRQGRAGGGRAPGPPDR